MKLTIEEFAEEVLEKLKEVLDSIYNVTSVSMWKNNNILLHGIQIKQAGKNVAPVIYLNDLFKQGAYVEDAVQWVLNVFYNSQVDDIDTTELMKFDNIKSRIRCKLINYDLNREYLQNKVFVRFLDLAVVFTIEMYLNMDDVENAVIVITKSLFGFWDINESQLFDVAKENTLKYMEYSLMPIFDVLKALQQESQVTACDLEEFVNDSKLYVLSNKSKVLGATVVVNLEVLREVSERLQDDLVLLPSSIHEWMVLKKEDMYEIADKQGLCNLVKEVNDTELAKEDILSYNVYTYNRETDRMCLL